MCLDLKIQYLTCIMYSITHFSDVMEWIWVMPLHAKMCFWSNYVIFIYWHILTAVIASFQPAICFSYSFKFMSSWVISILTNYGIYGMCKSSVSYSTDSSNTNLNFPPPQLCGWLKFKSPLCPLCLPLLGFRLQKGNMASGHQAALAT